MSAIRTNAAAAMLGVSPNTLRSWETRFGYPAPRRSEGGHRQFDLAEIEALKQAYAETGDIAAAIGRAREQGESGATPARLQGAFDGFDAARADRVLEESMALRSLERTIEEVLLPAVQALAGGSPEYCFAWRYATGWLAAAQRVAPPSTREEGVLILDASRPLHVDALHTQALELFLRRGGLRVLALPVDLDSTRVGNALRALQPSAVVLAGSGAELDTIGRLVYAARKSAGEIEVLDFRGALPDSGASTVTRIGPDAGEAADALRERLGRTAVRTSARLAGVS
jgi:MerR family transcriptional regulator, light-induced transcriptional regulator